MIIRFMILKQVCKMLLYNNNIFHFILMDILLEVTIIRQLYLSYMFLLIFNFVFILLIILFVY